MQFTNVSVQIDVLTNVDTRKYDRSKYDRSKDIEYFHLPKMFPDVPLHSVPLAP